MKLVMDKETLITLEEYRAAHNLPKIENYGMSVEHNLKSKEIYDFISEVDFVNGDAFCFKCGGDGDNGEMFMSLLDEYFKQKECKLAKESDENEEINDIDLD